MPVESRSTTQISSHIVLEAALSAVNSKTFHADRSTKHHAEVMFCVWLILFYQVLGEVARSLGLHHLCSADEPLVAANASTASSSESRD